MWFLDFSSVTEVYKVYSQKTTELPVDDNLTTVVAIPHDDDMYRYG